MEKWLKKNLRYITIILLGLFILKSIQGCNRKMSLSIREKNFMIEKDSLINLNKHLKISNKFIEDSLKLEITTRDFIIKDFINDLKIAGVRVDEAQKRVDAIQRTVEKIKTNTIIEIRGVEKIERDTTKIIKNEDEKTK